MEKAAFATNTKPRPPVPGERRLQTKAAAPVSQLPPIRRTIALC
jgi:hypothetical protein